MLEFRFGIGKLVSLTQDIRGQISFSCHLPIEMYHLSQMIGRQRMSYTYCSLTWRSGTPYLQFPNTIHNISATNSTAKTPKLLVTNLVCNKFFCFLLNLWYFFFSDSIFMNLVNQSTYPPIQPRIINIVSIHHISIENSCWYFYFRLSHSFVGVICFKQKSSHKLKSFCLPKND